MIEYLVQGLVLGSAAGILPGPVMMFSLSQVLKNSTWSGFKVQLGATLIDIVRIIITIFLFSYLPHDKLLVGIISFVGGLFLLYMAWNNFRYQPNFEVPDKIASNPLAQGALGNILNTSAYIFWLTVGGPIMLAANNSGASWGGVILFALGFLIAITVLGAVIAILAGRIKRYLSSIYYTYTIRALGLVLIIFAVLFFKQAYLNLI